MSEVNACEVHFLKRQQLSLLWGYLEFASRVFHDQFNSNLSGKNRKKENISQQP